MNTLPHNRRIYVAFLCAVVIAAALAIRIFHDHSAHGSGSISDLELQSRTHPEDIKAQLAYGAALDSEHRYDEAEAVLRAAAATAPRNALPLDALARLAMERLRADEAINYMSSSVQLNPNSAANWSCLGTLLSKKDPSAALQAFSHATSLDPNDAYSWLKLGILEMDRHHFDRGMHELQRAASLNPNDAETEIALGNSAQYNNRPTVAKVAFDRALALRPDDPKALLGSANITLQLDPSAAGLTRAGQQVERVMANNPTASAYVVRGHWNLLMRRYQPAISDLTTALSLEPKLKGSHSLLSQAYSALGEAQLAKRESIAYMAGSLPNSSDSTSHPERIPGL